VKQMRAMLPKMPVEQVKAMLRSARAAGAVGSGDKKKLLEVVKKLLAGETAEGSEASDEDRRRN